MEVLGGKLGEGVVRYWPPTNSFLLFGVLTSVPILVKIDQEMRPWECSQTDRHTDRHTDANRFYNLSHAICYSYGTDNKSRLISWLTWAHRATLTAARVAALQQWATAVHPGQNLHRNYLQAWKVFCRRVVDLEISCCHRHANFLYLAEEAETET